MKTGFTGAAFWGRVHSGSIWNVAVLIFSASIWIFLQGRWGYSVVNSVENNLSQQLPPSAALVYMDTLDRMPK